MAKAIGKSVRTVERASAKLVKEGRLRRVGPRKGGRWEIMSSYRKSGTGGATPQNDGTKGKGG